MINSQSIRQAFQSILRADYISISDSEQLKKLEGYYVDIYKNLPIILQDQDNFINGRRGSGKTTLLMRSFFECLKTVSPKISDISEYIGIKKVLPIYIDLSQCKDIFDEDDEQTLERTFISKIVSELRSQLSIMFELNNFKLFKKDTSKLEEFDYIYNVLKYGIEIKVSTKDKKEEIKTSTKDNIGGSISLKDMQFTAGIEESQEAVTTQSIEHLRGVSVQEFLSMLGSIRKESKLDAIYIFIDEFSELSSDEQNKFSVLLKKLLGSKIIFFLKLEP